MGPRAALKIVGQLCIYCCKKKSSEKNEDCVKKRKSERGREIEGERGRERRERD
jgi:hypothetical protein